MHPAKPLFDGAQLERKRFMDAPVGATHAVGSAFNFAFGFHRGAAARAPGARNMPAEPGRHAAKQLESRWVGAACLVAPGAGGAVWRAAPELCSAALAHGFGPSLRWRRLCFG